MDPAIIGYSKNNDSYLNDFNENEFGEYFIGSNKENKNTQNGDKQNIIHYQNNFGENNNDYNYNNYNDNNNYIINDDNDEQKVLTPLNVNTKLSFTEKTAVILYKISSSLYVEYTSNE